MTVAGPFGGNPYWSEIDGGCAYLDFSALSLQNEGFQCLACPIGWVSHT